MSVEKFKRELNMKKIALILLLIMVANASNLSGVYYNKKGALMEITEKKDSDGSGDIQFFIRKGQCDVRWSYFKSEIRKNKLIYTDDQGYGPLHMARLTFSKNSVDVDLSDKLMQDQDYSKCSSMLPAINGKYIKK